jgi:hypothetical protein
VKFALIFALGSDMGQYYCLLDAEDLPAAQARAADLYPSRWTYLLPYDSRFLAHVRVYQKVEIPLGATSALLGPDDEVLSRSR